MADVEDPARVSPQLAADGCFDVGPRHDLRIDWPLHQAVVEEARRAVALTIHRDQANHSRRGVERLRQPGRVAGDLVCSWGAGHAAP